MRSRWELVLTALCVVSGALAGGTAKAPPAPEAPPVLGQRAWFGILLADAVDGGVRVVEVVPNGPAARAGLLAGDLVIRADGSDVVGRDDLSRVLATRAPGDPLVLTVLRDGRAQESRVVLGTPPVAPRSGEIVLPMRRAPTASTVLGVDVEEIPDELRRHLGGPAEAGVLVTRVRANGPAVSAIRLGDLLVRVDGSPLATEADLDRAVLAHRSGPLLVSGVRDKGAFETKIALADTAARRGRDDRVRALDAEIRQLETRLAELRRQLAALKSGP